MKITDLQIDRFGTWRGLDISDLPEELTVFYGPNEAGKTTLLDFVRTVLYGFSPGRCHRYVPTGRHGVGSPEEAPPVGGYLRVSTAEESYCVQRYASQPDSLNRPGELRIASDDGTRHGGHRLGSLLSGIDESIFNNVFALGLSELQQLGTLNDTEAAEQLYSLSTGVDRVSLADVMRELNTARDRLLTFDQRPSLVKELLDQSKRQASEIDKHASQTELWTRLRSRHHALAEEVTRLEKHRDQLIHRSRVMEMAMAIRPQWAKCRQLSDQLTQLEETQNVPSGLLERLRHIKQTRTERQQQADQLKQKRSQLREKVKKLAWNEDLWRRSTQIHVLADQRNWIVSLDDQVRALENQVEEIEFEMQAEQEKLGFPGEPPLPGSAQVSPDTLSALRRPARALRRAQKRMASAKRQAVARRQEVSQCEQQIAAVLNTGAESPTGEKNWDLVEAVEQTGELASSLRRQVQLEDLLGQLQLHLGDIQARRDLLIERQVLPVRVLAGVACLFVLGFVLLLTGLFGGIFSLTDSSRLVMTLAGSAAAGAAVVVKKMLERSNAEQLQACARQCDLIQSQAEDARQEAAHLSAQISQGEGTLEVRLQRAEDGLAELEQLLPLDAQRQAAAQQAQLADEKMRAVAAAREAAGDRWQAALRSVGLSEKLTPVQIRHLTDQSGRLSHLGVQLDQLRPQLEHRRHELSSVRSQLAQLLSDVGISPEEAPRPVDQLELLIRATKQQEQAASQRRSLGQQARQLRREYERLMRNVHQLERKRRSIISAAGVTSEAELERLEEQRATAHELARQQEQLACEIAATLQGRVSEEAVAKELDGEDRDDLQERRRRLDREVDSTQEKFNQLNHERGELSQRLRTLQSDGQRAQQNLDLASNQRQLELGLRRWKVLGVASHLLESVYRQYENDRQPETLKEASGYLHRFTQGRYTRVWTPLSEKVLRIDQPDDHSLPIELLSRGTREQVYLSLRLALVAAYARRGTRMPMVLDDVLVNFDTDRALAAAEVLADFSHAGHQLLVFTCHMHVREIFEQLGVAVRELPRRDGQTNATKGRNVRKRRKTNRRKKRAETCPVVETPEKRPVTDDGPPQTGEVPADQGLPSVGPTRKTSQDDQEQRESVGRKKRTKAKTRRRKRRSTKNVQEEEEAVSDQTAESFPTESVAYDDEQTAEGSEDPAQPDDSEPTPHEFVEDELDALLDEHQDESPSEEFYDEELFESAEQDEVWQEDEEVEADPPTSYARKRRRKASPARAKRRRTAPRRNVEPEEVEDGSEEDLWDDDQEMEVDAA